jgi:predicted ABC-type ATPase
MPNLYIIAGCNGAGKTTASLTVLPEVLNCFEFVNADSIAAGLSPLNPDSVAFEAGRIMLNRIRHLLNNEVDFAFETTLSTKSYVLLIKEAKAKGYQITLLCFWLNSPELAINRVANRVSQGGHNIPVDVIIRRYYRGLYNLINLYTGVVDVLMVSDNAGLSPKLIASSLSGKVSVIQKEFWHIILKQASHGK